MRPRRSTGAMSTFHADPAVNTVPSPAPRKSRDTIRPGMLAGRKRRAPATTARSAPAITVTRRPRRSAARPASGLQKNPVAAKAPVTMATSRSEPFSSSVTNFGITGRVAPTASRPRLVTMKMPANEAQPGPNVRSSRPPARSVPAISRPSARLA